MFVWLFTAMEDVCSIIQGYTNNKQHEKKGRGGNRIRVVVREEKHVFCLYIIFFFKSWAWAGWCGTCHTRPWPDPSLFMADFTYGAQGLIHDNLTNSVFMLYTVNNF